MLLCTGFRTLTDKRSDLPPLEEPKKKGGKFQIGSGAKFESLAVRNTARLEILDFEKNIKLTI